MSDSSMLPPAAWYADPQDPAALRYWDGSQWTDQTRPMVAEPVAPAPEPVRAAEPEVPAQPAAVAEPVAVAPVTVAPQPVQQQASPAVVEPITVQPAVQETVGFARGDDELRVTETVVEPISFAPSSSAASSNDTALYPGFAAEVAALRVAADEAADDDGDAVAVEVADAAPGDASGAEVVVATTTELPGHRIVSVVGPVVGVAVRRHSDLSGGFGSGGDPADMLTATRHEALDRLSAAAALAGATGVIGLEFKEASFADLVEIAVYGTGVIAERE